MDNLKTILLVGLPAFGLGYCSRLGFDWWKARKDRKTPEEKEEE